jgi:hypothetical protein
VRQRASASRARSANAIAAIARLASRGRIGRTARRSGPARFPVRPRMRPRNACVPFVASVPWATLSSGDFDGRGQDELAHEKQGPAHDHAVGTVVQFQRHLPAAVHRRTCEQGCRRRCAEANTGNRTERGRGEDTDKNER